jgi:hypothetical protein
VRRSMPKEIKMKNKNRLRHSMNITRNSDENLFDSARNSLHTYETLKKPVTQY